VLGADVDQLVLFQEVQAPVVADRVGDPGADEVAEHACRDHAEQGQVSFGDAEAGEEHDRLAGNRDAGRLQDHQQEDRSHPGGADEFGGDVDDRFDDLVAEAGEDERMHRWHFFFRALTADES
jgi:hypothetical protein